MERLIELALAEDAADRDLTAIATIAENALGSAIISAKANGILSGTPAAKAVFAAIDERIACRWLKHDGEAVSTTDVICELSGPLRSLLAAERTVLNFLQHLSGVATATHRYVEATGGAGCLIVDTRKTMPGMRHLEKQAVLDGGGTNHRLDLQGGMLIKENHIQACGSISDAVRACRLSGFDAWVEVECETQAEVEEAVAAAPDIILLDNMSPAEVIRARRIVPASITLEASGNITLENIRDYAETGVDRVAIGAITHSAAALDLSMRIINRL